MRRTREGIDVLERADHINLVLMDIMMPEWTDTRRWRYPPDGTLCDLRSSRSPRRRCRVTGKALDAGASEIDEPVSIDSCSA